MDGVRADASIFASKKILNKESERNFRSSREQLVGRS
jgi:hypothetical protein